VDKHFKQYAREEFELWMVANDSYKISIARGKAMPVIIINTWAIIVHNIGDEEDETEIQENRQEEEEQARQAEDQYNDGEEGCFLLEEEPTRRRPDLMDVDDNEPLFVLKPNSEEKA
jgi:hypothetical protein